MSNHLGLNLHLGEDLAIVHTHDGAGHLGDHDHVPQVSLHDVGLFIRGHSFFFLWSFASGEREENLEISYL